MNNFWNKLKDFRVVVGTAALVAALSGQAALAQSDFPQQPINLIVGFGAGGGVDTFARVFAGNVKEGLRVPLVVVNSPGAASANAAKQVIGSRADGYTLLVTNGSTLAAKVALMGNGAGMDMGTDLVTLGSIGALVTALMVPADSPFKSAAELVEYAAAHPGKLRWSHPGRGSLHMLGGAVFLQNNGIEAQDVPFKGGGKARNAVAGGQVDFGFMGVQLVSGFEETMRAIGVTSLKRDPVFNDVPTFEEQGLPQMQLNGPITIYAPTGTPGDVVALLVEAFAKAAQSEEFLSAAQEGGLSAGYASPSDTNATISAVMEALSPVIAELAVVN